MWFEISALPTTIGKSLLSKLIACCWWEDETARERTGHLPLYVEGKKMKCLTLNPHACLRVSLRDCSFSSICIHAKCVYMHSSSIRAC